MLKEKELHQTDPYCVVGMKGYFIILLRQPEGVYCQIDVIMLDVTIPLLNNKRQYVMQRKKLI